MGFAVSFIVRGGEFDEHGTEEGKNHPLQDSNKDLEEIEGQWNNDAEEEVDGGVAGMHQGTHCME